MEKDLESFIQQGQPDGQFPIAKSPKLLFEFGMQNSRIPSGVPHTDTTPSNCLPAYGFSGLPYSRLAQFDHPHGWFYCLPRFNQGVVPNMTPHEKFLPKTNLPGNFTSFVNEDGGEVNSPIITDNDRAQKQFLVFDQSGNKTTMIFSSGIGTPIQLLSSLRPKATGYCNVDKGEKCVASNGNYHSGPNLTDELDEGSEMREDTGEINALLYSDDEDDYSEDGEETSTGHSPSTMTAYEKQDWFEEDDMDEVASSAGPVKRQKVSENGNKVPSVTKTGSSVKPNMASECEDDAESRCAGGKLPARNQNTGSLSGNKRFRKEKIRETVSILQTIIPGGKGKDTVMVLDEAINYLRTLRFKATSLGLSAF